MKLPRAGGNIRLLASVSWWHAGIIALGFLVAVGVALYVAMNEANAAVDKQAMLSLDASGPDYAGSPPGDGQDKEATSDGEVDPRMAKQAPLADASSQIHQLWWERGLPNFTGVRLDNDRNAVILYWKGPPPPEMADLVENLRVNVTIEVVDSPYSLSEFQQEAKRLVELDPTTTGVNVTQAGPLPDFSGLRVAVESAEQIDRARQVIQSPIRLEFTVAPKGKPLFSRWDDISPFWGGAAIDHSLGFGQYAYCTTGFAVTTSSNTEGSLVADHCKYGWDYYTPEGDVYVGTVSNPGNCISGVQTLIGESYDPYIYVGPWDSSQAKHVAGWEFPAVAQFVFVSGSWSGEHLVRVELLSREQRTKHIPPASGKPGSHQAC